MKCSIIAADRIDQLKEIWRKCYPEDPESYIDFFFKNGFQYSKCVGISDAEQVIGVIYLFPCYIAETDKKAYYFYAGGVLPSYRGKGCYRRLIAYAAEYCIRNEYEMLCYPLPSLRQFYEQMGFTEQYYYAVSKITESDILNGCDELKIQPVQPSELLNIMRFHAQYGDVLWDESVMEYVCREYQFSGGICCKLFVNDIAHYMFYKKDGEKLIVTDTSVSLERIKRLSGSLMEHSQTKQIVVWHRVYADDKSSRVLSSIGSLKIHNPSKWYVLTML